MGYRLSWHSAVYGGKRPSGKAESVVSPEALRAYPVKFDENGKPAKPPIDSNHDAPDIGAETKGAPKRRRRTTSELGRQLREPAELGLVQSDCGLPEHLRSKSVSPSYGSANVREGFQNVAVHVLNHMEPSLGRGVSTSDRDRRLLRLEAASVRPFCI
jgi:hypothetical protein